MENKELTFDIVWYLSGDWETDHRRQMILSFTKNMPAGGKNLCVNRPVCLLTSPFLKTKKYFSWLMGKQVLKRISDNIYTFTPYVILHDRIALKVRLVSYLNKKILSRSLKKVLKKVGFESSFRISWIYLPYQMDYLGLVEDKGYIYENYDDYPEFNTPFLTRAKIKEFDSCLAKNASMVFTTALKLYKEKLLINSKTYYFPNAVNLEVFSRALNHNRQPQDLRDVPRPIVGFVGNVHKDFVDLQLLKHITSANPGVSFVFIGKLKKISKSEEIFIMPNVYYLGHKIYEDIPYYIKCFDVGIIPFKLNKITRSLNPLKFFEYIAAGCPVVATEIPELQKYSNLIAIARNSKEFSISLMNILSSDVQDLKKRLLKEANKHSWDNRSKEMVLHIQQGLVGDFQVKDVG